MERPTRSLRKLPVRLSAERSASRGRNQDVDSGKVPVSPRQTRVVKEKDKKSPPRRSRSRSAGRRKVINQKVTEEKKESATTRSTTTEKSKATPTKIVPRIRESVESVRNSLGPDMEEVLRRSVSKFEEIKANVVRSLTPPASSLTVTSRISTLRQRTKEENSIKTIDNSQEEFEYTEERIRNHVGEKKEGSVLREVGQVGAQEVDEERSNIVQTVLLLIAGLLLLVLTLAAHTICNKNDCRLLLPTLEKVLNYRLYFDEYVWAVNSVTLVVLFLTSYFQQTHQKKTKIVSPLGLALGVVSISAVLICHKYYNGVKSINPLHILSATIFHVLILIAVADNSHKLHGVKLDPFIVRLSAILTVILEANIGAVESSRADPRPGIYLAIALPVILAIDSLIAEPLPSRRGGLSLFYGTIKPFLFALSQVYVSANNIRLDSWVLGAATATFVIGYVLYRTSLVSKALYSLDPYSKNHLTHSVYGIYIGGAWKKIRHPDLLGLLLCELSLALTTYPCPLSWVLPLIFLVDAVLTARKRDHSAHPGYLRTVKYSLLPALY